MDAVLFDLDGTLLDTAPDMALALNHLRDREGLEPLSLAQIRPHVGFGTKALLKLSFNMDEAHPKYQSFFESYLAIYDTCLTTTTNLFPGMSVILEHLENNDIPWGIVTNKPSRFTHLLLDHLDLRRRSACIVSGDTLAERKPHPAPILHACQLIQSAPNNTLYIGDAITDIIASKAAGTRAIAALYGYIEENVDPHSWGADGYINNPAEIKNFVKIAEIA